MKRIALALIVIILILPSINILSAEDPETGVLKAKPLIPNDLTTPTDEARIMNNLHSMGGFFTENQGQVGNDDVRYYIRGGGVWFLDDCIVFDIQEPVVKEIREDPFMDPFMEEEREPQRVRGVVLKLQFVGCNEVVPEGRGMLSHRSNFFYGNVSSEWRTEVPNYGEIYYTDIYDGIDLRYYTNEKGLKYDFIVRPGAEVSDIRMRGEGAEGLDVNEEGDLVIKTEVGDMVDGGLFIYQNTDEIENHIKGRFIILKDKEYGFKIDDDYNFLGVLIIDPFLDYSTFIGGSSSDHAYDISVDNLKCAYITGQTYSSNFPTSPGAYDTSFNNNYEAYITKLNQSGSSLVYSTYISGSAGTSGTGISVDSSYNAYMSGYTASTNFPTTFGAFDTTYNGGPSDGVVVKLDSSGSMLVYSTFLGGNNRDYPKRNSINVSGEIFLCGLTYSNNFPTTPGVIDSTFNGGPDGFVCKINTTGSSLLYSTFIGGSGWDHFRFVTSDATGNAYVTGESDSSNFPTTIGAYDQTYNGGDDVVFIKLNPNGSALLYSTFIGTPWLEDIGFIGHALDGNGDIYITGSTNSPNFQTTSGAYDQTHNGNKDVFVLKLTLNNSGPQDLIYSTFIGGSGKDEGWGIGIDSIGNVFISGDTESSSFPTTSNAYDNTLNGTNDIFLLKLSSDGSTLLYSTYFGAFRTRSIAISFNKHIFITGITQSELQTTPFAFDTTYNGGFDAFITKFTFTLSQEFNITSVFLRNETNDPTDKIFTKSGIYKFRIKVLDTVSLQDIHLVNLTLDPQGVNITLCWNRSTDQFSKESDPDDVITLKSSSQSFNDSFNLWTIDFDIVFNWTFPDESFQDVQVLATSETLSPSSSQSVTSNSVS